MHLWKRLLDSNLQMIRYQTGDKFDAAQLGSGDTDETCNQEHSPYIILPFDCTRWQSAVSGCCNSMCTAGASFGEV